MFRNLIAVQLVVALLASQWLCCCTAFASVGRAAVSAGGSRATAPTAAGHSCCGHRKATPESKKDTAPGHAPHKPGDKKDCPCKDKGQKAKLAAPSADGAQASSNLRFALSDASFFCSWQLASDAAHLCTAWGWARAAAPLPSLTADELLFAHHNLRC